MLNNHQMKESSLRDLDDKMKWLKNFERLLEIQVFIVIIVTIAIIVIIIIFVNNIFNIFIISEMWSGPV